VQRHIKERSLVLSQLSAMPKDDLLAHQSMESLNVWLYELDARFLLEAEGCTKVTTYLADQYSDTANNFDLPSSSRALTSCMWLRAHLLTARNDAYELAQETPVHVLDCVQTEALRSCCLNIRVSTYHTCTKHGMDLQNPSAPRKEVLPDLWMAMVDLPHRQHTWPRTPQKSCARTSTPSK
jgi:hypothetical protein